MDPDPIVSVSQIVIIISAFILGAFFSLLHAAFQTINPARLITMLDTNDTSAKGVERALQDTDTLFTGLLFVKTVSMVLTSILLAEIFISRFGDLPVVLLLTTAIIGLVELLCIELIPRKIGISYPIAITQKAAGIVNMLCLICRPLLFFLNILVKGFLSLFQLSQKEKPTLTESELKYLLEASMKAGVINPGEQNIIHNIFDFKDTFVRDVMISRMHMEAIQEDATMADVLRMIAESEFSRYPIYKDSLDDVTGIFYVKDLIFSGKPMKAEGFSVNHYKREAFFTYEQKPVGELLNDMQKRQWNIAIVLDEYGGTSGLVTMEDLVEEIVGDIFDEYDHMATEITTYGDNEYIVHGAMRILDFNEKADIGLASEQYETIGGFILEHMGHIPETGHVVAYDQITFTVLEMNKNKIETVKIKIDPAYYVNAD